MGRLGGSDQLESTVRKRSVSIQGHRTSLSLEPAFWAGLQVAARDSGQSIGELVAMIDALRVRDASGGLSSAVRVWLYERALHEQITPSAPLSPESGVRRAGDRLQD